MNSTHAAWCAPSVEPKYRGPPSLLLLVLSRPRPRPPASGSVRSIFFSPSNGERNHKPEVGRPCEGDATRRRGTVTGMRIPQPEAQADVGGRPGKSRAPRGPLASVESSSGVVSHCGTGGSTSRYPAAAVAWCPGPGHQDPRRRPFWASRGATGNLLNYTGPLSLWLPSTLRRAHAVVLPVSDLFATSARRRPGCKLAWVGAVGCSLLDKSEVAG